MLRVGYKPSADLNRSCFTSLLISTVALTRLGAQSSAAPAPTAWYDRIRIRGYGQVRYNRLFESNDSLQCEQCDRSWGANGGLFIRRARLVIQGQIHPRVFLYLQPDFAGSVGTSGNIAQLRDLYADVGLDAKNEYRLRIGQSKIPFGYENLQSSQNRLPLDRADGTNSAHANERDIGVFFMWAPQRARTRFSRLVSDGLKGSGDYGVLAIGAFNGQTANRAEANNTLHVSGRLTYPFAIGTQILEPAVAAYTGRYVITPDQRSAGVNGSADWSYRDRRILGTIALAPKPVGILAEYNVGSGPEYNTVTDSIETRALRGGFVTLSYRVAHAGQVLFPFTRYQVYRGGKKHERDARSYGVNDLEIGLEWQPNPSLELVTTYYHGDRRFEDHVRPQNTQRGHLLRMQLQVNY